MLTIQQGNERVIHAQGTNISRSGLGCSTTEKLQPGSTAYLILELQDSGVPRVSAEAIVVWCDPRMGGYDAGLVFRTLYENSARALDQFLTHRESRV
jgi:hypothetical protein